jgi:Flp pilus assembly protein TadG
MRERLRSMNRQEGTAAIEFAIVVTLLLMVVFGIITFGRVYNEYEVLTSAAREGARVAAVRGSASDAIAAVEDASAGYALSETPSVSTTCDDSTQGEPVKVGWTQAFDIDIPFLPSMTQDVTIQGTFRCE